jgi:hypothetical protein
MTDDKHSHTFSPDTNARHAIYVKPMSLLSPGISKMTTDIDKNQ